MVVGLFIITAIPTVTGVAQAMSAQKSREERLKEEKRMKKFHIGTYCEDQASLKGQRIVLRNERVWIGPAGALNPCQDGYVAEAFYVEYPDNERVPVPLGLVSQVQDDPPLLNWIYVDKDTMELKYGNKTASIAHHVGPWDWTEDEGYVTFDESPAFTAVQDPQTRKWQLYYDMDDDGLTRFVPKGRRQVLVGLERTLMPES